MAKVTRPLPLPLSAKENKKLFSDWFIGGGAAATDDCGFSVELYSHSEDRTERMHVQTSSFFLTRRLSVFLRRLYTRLQGTSLVL